METHKYSTMIIINPKADFFKMAEMAKNIITNNGGIIEDEHIELRSEEHTSELQS